MYSDNPPPLVFPDTLYGHRKAEAIKLEGKFVHFCGYFEEPSPYYLKSNKHFEVEKPCGQRKLGSPQNNWCLRCISGYPITAVER